MFVGVDVPVDPDPLPVEPELFGAPPGAVPPLVLLPVAESGSSDFCVLGTFLEFPDVCAGDCDCDSASLDSSLAVGLPVLGTSTLRGFSILPPSIP